MDIRFKKCLHNNNNHNNNNNNNNNNQNNNKQHNKLTVYTISKINSDINQFTIYIPAKTIYFQGTI